MTELISPSLKRYGPNLPWFPMGGDMILFCGGTMDGFLMHKDDWVRGELVPGDIIKTYRQYMLGELAQQPDRFSADMTESYLLTYIRFDALDGPCQAWFAVHEPLYDEAHRNIGIILMRQIHRWAQVHRKVVTDPFMRTVVKSTRDQPAP
jgi:hypothetical protein